jgi:hypothetical protein
MTRAQLVDLVAKAGRWLSQAIRDFRQRRTSICEVAHLNPQDATSIAHDLGVSASDLRALAAKDANSADLLARRMATVGLDPKRVDPAVMRDLQRCCSLCRDKGLCIHELEDRPREPMWPAYCPNQQTLAALTERTANWISLGAKPATDTTTQTKH